MGAGSGIGADSGIGATSGLVELLSDVVSDRLRKPLLPLPPPNPPLIPPPDPDGRGVNVLPPLIPPVLPPDIPPPKEPPEAPPEPPVDEPPPYAALLENPDVLASGVFEPLADLSEVVDVDFEESSADAKRCEEFAGFPD